MNLRNIIFLLIASLAAHPVHAATLFLRCHRYESKCKAAACYNLSDALREDKSGQIFDIKKTETVEYAIDGEHATGLLDNAAPNATWSNGKYTIAYKHSPDGSNIITMKSFTPDEKVKEQVEIDRMSGVYSHYLMHTDNTLGDIPLGEPYFAYFGWCEVIKNPQPQP